MNNFFSLTGCLFKGMLRSNNQSKWSKVALIIASIYLILFFGLTIVIMSLSLGMTFINDSMELGFISLLFAITQVVVLVLCVALLMNTLYFAHDHELLSTFPLKPSTIFWSKLFVVYMFALVLSALLLLCSGVPFGIIASLNAGYYIGLAFAIILVPFMAMFIASLLLIVLMPIIDRLKNYRILMTTILIVCIAVVLYFYFQFFTSDLFVIEETIKLSQNAINVINTITNILFFDTALAGLILGQDILINLLTVIIFNVGLFVLISVICNYSYTKGVQRSLEIQQTLLTTKILLGQNAKKSLMQREILNVTRYTSLVVYCSVSFILPPLIILFNTNFLNLGVDPFILGLILLAFIVFLNGSLQYFALSSFTREGKAFAGLKALPIDFKTFSKTKLIFASIMMLASVFVSLLCCVLVFDLPFWIYLFIGINSILICFGICCYSIICDAKSPRLEWDNIYSAMQNNVSALKVMAISLSIILVIAGWTLLNIFVFGWSGNNLIISIGVFTFVCAIIYSVLMYVYYDKKCDKYIADIEA